jgi:hypothetical protein
MLFNCLLLLYYIAPSCIIVKLHKEQKLELHMLLKNQKHRFLIQLYSFFLFMVAWFFNIFIYRSAVMVPDPRLDSSYHDAADQILSSLLDFNPSDWGLPPFELTAS